MEPHLFGTSTEMVDLRGEPLAIGDVVAFSPQSCRTTLGIVVRKGRTRVNIIPAEIFDHAYQPKKSYPSGMGTSAIHGRGGYGHPTPLSQLTNTARIGQQGQLTHQDMNLIAVYARPRHPIVCVKMPEDPSDSVVDWFKRMKKHPSTQPKPTVDETA
jgi:hypothetical protein